MKDVEQQYPFTAIVGQSRMKLALILNVVNPKLGGVLIRGEKGTAKSTAVRALAGLMPDLKVINLPVSATEDRVVGALDIEHAIKTGEKKFEPGLLAAAHGHILYIDEINLLDDHIVDVLLDAAAMGINTVEREGISYSHPSRFLLVGTMNPEEGDLRPQLLDRFALSVDIGGEKDVRERALVIRRRMDFERDPASFSAHYEAEQERVLNQILQARERLDQIDVTDDMLELAAKIGIALEVEGHRSDITLIKTALTLAAWRGQDSISHEHMQEAAYLVLPHRMRRQPFEESGGIEQRLHALLRSTAMVQA
ncbi:ATP-binding protein [Paenibacillus lautus]|uniref:ATP-binding protein n=1 Tax=Paenibacillus lautus TaxID=1401 RepID=UPI001C7CB325|nr:AAA family ATPase [Paenibacillus lautus]MBX4148638.1 AAA family ATPase [Paenibacillus lautus]